MPSESLDGFKWIKMVEIPNGSAKTKRFQVCAKDYSALGEVKWYSRWRRFAFFPCFNTIFEPTCLRDIADFCESETTKRQKERRFLDQSRD